MRRFVSIIIAVLVMVDIAAKVTASIGEPDRLIRKDGSVHIECEYSLEDFTIEYKDSLVKVSAPPAMLVDYPELLPHLPKLLYQIDISGNARITDVTWEMGDRVLVAQGVELVARPVQYYMPKYVPEELRGDEWPHYDGYDGIFPNPKDRVEWKTSFVNIHGYLLFWSVYPFEYDSDTRSLYFYPTFTMQVALEYTSNSAPQARSPLTEDLLSSEASIGLGSEGIAPNKLNPDLDFDGHGGLNAVDYLIITQDSLKTAFNSLIEWKKTKGLTCKVETVDEIYKKYSAGSNPMKIKLYLDSMFNRHDVAYVMLGGDAANVPTLKTYGQASIRDDSGKIKLLTSKDIPTDLFYACLKGSDKDWDKNKNGVYGEFRPTPYVLNTGVDSCTVCITGSGRDGLYRLVRRNVRTVIISELPRQGKICITKQNYVPYVMDLSVFGIGINQLETDVIENPNRISGVIYEKMGNTLKIDYQLEDSAQSCQFLISNIVGTQSLIADSSVDDDTVNIDVPSFPIGVYSVTMIVDGASVDSMKCIIK